MLQRFSHRRTHPKLFIHACVLASVAVSSLVWADPPAALPDVGLTTEQKLKLIASHSQAFQILDEKIRDPFILRGPDNNFYLTGTTAGLHWGSPVGVRIWKSKDLAAWQDLGFVWELLRDGKEQESWHFSLPGSKHENPRAIWAPEIHFMKDTWWIPHSQSGGGHGLLKSLSGKPEGPYAALPAVAMKGIDAHLYEENGIVYYLWGSKNIVRLTPDMSETDEAAKTIGPSGKHPLGYEGILLTKFGDKYLLMASGRYAYELSNTYDLYCCVSHDLYGPYGPRRMAVKNAGHGNLFQDNEGRWWCTAFDHEFTNQWSPWLVPIEIRETPDDLELIIKDERFRPTEADQAFVAAQRKTGIPPGREGKRPWDK